MKSGIHKNIKIVGCYVGESAEKKTPFYGLEFENAEGERIEKDFFFSSDASKKDYNEKLIQQLINAGYRRKSLADMADPKLSIDDLFGEPTEEMSITVEEEAYSTKSGEAATRQSVKWFNIGQGGKSKADHAGAKMIFKNHSYDSLFVKLKKGDKPAPKPKEDTKSEQSFTSDDIPF